MAERAVGPASLDWKELLREAFITCRSAVEYIFANQGTYLNDNVRLDLINRFDDVVKKINAVVEVLKAAGHIGLSEEVWLIRKAILKIIADLKQKRNILADDTHPIGTLANGFSKTLRAAQKIK